MAPRSLIFRRRAGSRTPVLERPGSRLQSARLFTSLVQDRIESFLIGNTAHTLLNRTQKLDRRFCQITLQLRVTLARKMIFNFLCDLPVMRW